MFWKMESPDAMCYQKTDYLGDTAKKETRFSTLSKLNIL